MGTLADMAGNASNTSNTIKRQSTASMASQALSGVTPSENLGKKSPHFMSPTVSSSKQSMSRSSRSAERTRTPPSSLKAKTNANWVSSAAKRVGFSKIGDGTPKGKKEGKQSKAVIFPDKVGLSSTYAETSNTGSNLRHSHRCRCCSKSFSHSPKTFRQHSFLFLHGIAVQD